MISFPDNAEDFYKLRDDRTARYGVEVAYQQSHCSVVFDIPLAETMQGQVSLIAVCNLLSRWCRNVTIIGPTVKPHDLFKSKQSTLQELILEQMRCADSFGNFLVKTEARTGVDGIELQVSTHNKSDTHLTSVFINASGWLASVSYSRTITLDGGNPKNCLGAIAAACIGVSEAFKIATRGYHQIEAFDSAVFDLFSFTRLENEHTDKHAYNSAVNLGNLLMVGAGSIGSAVAYCLGLSGALCDLTIIDKDKVKIENFNRSPIFGKRFHGFNKAEAIAKFLEGSNVKAVAFPVWWDDFFKQYGRAAFQFDAWLPLANEHGVRSAIQNNVPPLMIHASTTVNWGVNYGRHIPRRDDCLLDRFPETTAQSRLTCATGPVVSQTTTIDAALPFLSLFGGLLVVADLLRIHLPEYPQVPNFALFDFYGPFVEMQRMDKRPAPSCVCQSHNSALHKALNGKSKYWLLSL